MRIRLFLLILLAAGLVNVIAQGGQAKSMLFTLTKVPVVGSIATEVMNHAHVPNHKHAAQMMYGSMVLTVLFLQTGFITLFIAVILTILRKTTSVVQRAFKRHREE